MGRSSGGVRGGNGGYPRATDSYEREVINLHKRQNVREIYDSFWQSQYVDRFGNGSSYELEGKGGAILQSVYDNGTGAAKDIAAKFIDPSRYEMSSKQKWAVSYAFKNLKPNQIKTEYDFKARRKREDDRTYNRLINSNLRQIDKQIARTRKDKHLSATEKERWLAILEKEKERAVHQYDNLRK